MTHSHCIFWFLIIGLSWVSCSSPEKDTQQERSVPAATRDVGHLDLAGYKAQLSQLSLEVPESGGKALELFEKEFDKSELRLIPSFIFFPSICRPITVSIL